MEGDVTERTPLHPTTGAPMYVFSANAGRLYRNRVRHFQCCICASLLAIFVLAVVIAVSLSINEDTEDRNSTSPNATEMAFQQLQVLLSSNWPIEDESPQGEWPSPGPSQEKMVAAVEAGSAAALARMRLEAAMPQLPVDSPSYRHQMAVATGAAANTRARAGFATDEATKRLVKDIGKAPGSVRGPRVSAPWQPDDVCADEDGVDAGGFPPCPPTARASPWRAQDGRCNNLARPWLGAALRPFRRVLPADYADGVSAPRNGRGGSTLPSAREVSITVHRPQYRDDASFSILLAVWGQFIDHDITATALSKRSTDGGAISCCYAAKSSGLKAHPECFPVMLGPGDPFFDQYNVTCMEFVRSAPAPACRFGPREQLNQATSFLDASVVYGASEELMKQLRSGEGGRLRMLVTDDGRELLPASTDPNDGCNRAEESAKGRYCFFSGDARGNENLHLTTMHLLLARQHNRLARALHERNPSWGDDRLFQEARRVVSAQMQHITYNEFVPILLGNELMTKLGLHPLTEGYSKDYDPKTDPRIANVFAAAAFRFAHTLLPGLMRMISNTSSEYVELHKVLFNPFALYAGEGPVLRGALRPGLLRFDPHFSPQVSQHLFERAASPKGPCGLDLVSLNIQRGRDHGLPPYPAWRRHCGFSEPKSFGDLQGIFDDDSLSRIAAIFKSVEDIDPYSGMLAETPIPGGMLGPTLSCILSDQFVRLRRGDRYWYETGEMPQAFSPAQLQEVRKTTLAQLLCDTSDSVTSIQRWVLHAPGDDNPRVPCASLPRVNLDAWNGAPDPAPPAPQLGPAVHIQGSGASARSFGPGAPPTGPIARGTATKLPLRLGAFVASARVSSSAGHAWYGAFPLELPLPLFDSIRPVGTKAAPVMSSGVQPHGILWEGTLHQSSPGFLTFTGEFSLPKYIHGDGLANFSIEWINGDFEFELQVLWNTSDISDLNIDGSYSSPVYVGGRKKYAALQNETASKLFDVTGEYRESPSLDIDPVVKKAPIILLGIYSPDGTNFLWSGNVTAIIPDAVVVTPWGKSSYWSGTMAEIPMKQMPWIPRSPEVETIPVSAGVSSALQISVLTGKVTLSSDGTTSSAWDGTLPLSISMPATKNVYKIPSIHEVSYGSGVTWDAKLQRMGNTTLNVQGKFSIPVFVKDVDAPFGIEWKEGSFSFDFTILWNVTSLDVLFQEGRSYSSPVYFRESESTENVNDIIEGMQGLKQVEGSAELQFIAATVADSSNLPKTPIILKGAFSADKKQFLWDGHAVIIFPSGMEYQPLKMSPKSPSCTLVVGANVLGGSITGQANGQTSTTLWKGDLPMPIRRPDIISKGITWSGELTSTSAIQVQLEGVFTALLPGETNSTFPFILYQGKFSLQLALLWNVSVDSLLRKCVSVFSPIYLRGSPAPDDAEDWFQPDEESISHHSYMANVQAPKDSIIVPIVLQGTYSSDFSTFWWSGMVLFEFPKPVVPLKSMVEAREKLIISYSTHMITPSLTSWYGVPWDSQVAATQPGMTFMRPLRLGATVRSGNIKTAAGSAWSGSLPLQLNLPLFDTIGESVKTADSTSNDPSAYAHGILWEGTISSTSAGKVNFYGQFSMPRYVHRNGELQNFSTQWINGDFNFDMDLLWNTSDITGLAIQGSYSSPLYLNAGKKYKYLINNTWSSVTNVEGALSQYPSLTPSPTLKKSPVILMGMYSPDGRSFMWSGNVTIVIPDIVPVPSWTTNSLWAEDNGAIPVPGSYLVPETASIENLAAINGASSAIGVTVTGGNIIVATNETNIRWWDGSLPVSVPTTAFNSVRKPLQQPSSDESKTELTASYSSGVIWDASLERVGNGKLRVQGKFSVPVFNHNPTSLFRIDWKVGTFDLHFSIAWNSTSFDDSFHERMKYSSPVFFSETKPTDTINDIINTLQELDGGEGNVDLQFVADAAAEAAAAPRAPIILMGSFSSDKSQFTWNGNATIIFPSIEGRNVFQMNVVSDNEIKKKPILGANVLSGSIVAGETDTLLSTLWNGELPVRITRPDLLSRGIIWKGSINTTSVTTVMMDGTFSAMWPSTEGDSYPFTLYQGKFSIELGLLWNISADIVLPPDSTIYSPIYLHGSTKAPQSKSWFAINDDLRGEVKQIKPPPEAAGAIFVPIILQGGYSPDLTIFWWSGKVIIPFTLPSNTVSNGGIERNKKRLIITSQEVFLQKADNNMDGEVEVTFRPLKLGATVTSGSITTSTGQVWTGTLPLDIPLPMFDSVASSNLSSSSTPIYSHGIQWEGSLYSSSEGYISLSGKFSMPQYIHGGGVTNLEWLNGNFNFDLQVLWNASDISNVNIHGAYSSPLYLYSRKYYSHLQDVKIEKLPDLINDIKLTSSVGVLVSAEKKAPLILLGTYSSTGKSFIWSGNVSFSIPNAVPVSTWTSRVHPPTLKRGSPEDRRVNTIPPIPISSVAMGISVKGGSISILRNGTLSSWWNGSLPLSISSSSFSTDQKIKSEKSKSLYASSLVWDATLYRVDNTTVRLTGNYSIPIYEPGPDTMFAIDWMKGEFSLEFIVNWNRTSVDDIFKENRKYSSPIYFRVSKSIDTMSNIEVLQESNDVVGNPELEFVSESIADANSLPKTPIILFGNWSIDKSNFYWYGNAVIILPALNGPRSLLLSLSSSFNSPIDDGSRTVGAEAVDGNISIITDEMSDLTLWDGTLPFPIRRPDETARGVIWKGEFLESSINETKLEGSFSTTWSSQDYQLPFKGKFSLKLDLLWYMPLIELLPPGSSVHSPIYLKGPRMQGQVHEDDWFPDINEGIDLSSQVLQDVGTNLRVPIILQGTYSPDLSIFWWTGRVILSFPPPSLQIKPFVQAMSSSSGSVSAIVSSGVIVNSDGSKLWNGALPVTLSPALKTFKWSGSVSPAVGGTVELRGIFTKGKDAGNYAFVLTPFWNTPITDRVKTGMNYSSNIIMRDENDPALPAAPGLKSGNNVPIILLGSFSPDKSTFKWAGSVVIELPDNA